MYPKNLNDRSLYQMRMNQFFQEGGQPEMAAPNPGMEELLPTIKAALEQGASLVEIIITLAEQQVPIEAIAEAMQSMGVPQEEFVAAVQEIQASAQQGAPQQGPEGMPPEAQDAAVDPQMEEAQMQQMQEGMPLAQAGTETGENDPFVEFDATEGEPVETIKELEGDKRYDYKEVYDPATDTYNYYYKDKRGKTWKNAGKSGDQGYDAIRARVFGKDEQNWAEDDPRRIKHTKQMATAYTKEQIEKEAAKRKKINAETQNIKKNFNSKNPNAKDKELSYVKNAPTINEILKGGYKTKVINYPYGYKSMPPGHIEAVLVDPQGNPVPFYIDADGNLQDAYVNRWEKGGKEYITKTDSKGYDNVLDTHFKTKASLDSRIKSDPHIRAMDVEMDENQMLHFLTSTSMEGTRDYRLDEDNCAQGVCRAYNIDPYDVEDPIKIVGDAVNAFYDTDAFTDPAGTYDIIGGRNKVSNKSGSRISRTEGLHDMLDNSGHGDTWYGTIGHSLIDSGSDFYKDMRTANNVLQSVTPFDARNIFNADAYSDYWGSKSIDDFQPGMILDDPLGAVGSFFDYWGWGREYGGEPGRYGNLIRKAQQGIETVNPFAGQGNIKSTIDSIISNPSSRNIDIINEINRKAGQEQNSREWSKDLEKVRDWEKKQQLNKIFQQEREILNKRDSWNPKPPMPVFENNSGISPGQYSFDPTKAQTGTEAGRGALSGAARLRPTGYTKEELSSGSFNPNAAAKDVIDYFGGKGTQEKILKNVDKTLSNMGIPISINQTPTEAWNNTVSWWADALGFENGGEYAQVGKETGFGNFDPYLDANQPIVADNTRVDTGYSEQMNQLMQEVNDASKKGSKYRTTNPHDNPAKMPIPLSELMRFFEQGIMQGMTPQQVQMELYNSGLVSEQDYYNVQGLVNRYMNALKPKTIPRPTQDPMMSIGMNTPMQAMGMQKNGGQPKEIELTTEQVAAIMAAGGSVKFL